MRQILCYLLLIAAVSLPVLAQPRVDLRASYERVIAVVPIVGAGTAADPRRPLFVPAPPVARTAAPDRSGIIAFSWVMADDGRSAIVEFVARDRGALAGILDDTRVAGRVFERGVALRADVERELRRYKRDFNLDQFLGVAVQ